MFRKKKLYKITYRLMGIVKPYTMFIDAKDEGHALRKFRRTMGWDRYDMLGFEEYTVGRG